ncbi:hypothetical protein K0U27_05570 [archaeon]|nr:hypothetical protein [archaeon]
MQSQILEYNKMQAKPRSERQVTYFCRLCRKYNIKTRKAHLQNFHNASRDTVTKRSNHDLVDVIFTTSYQSMS